MKIPIWKAAVSQAIQGNWIVHTENPVTLEMIELAPLAV
jgi:hypothetical protein